MAGELRRFTTGRCLGGAVVAAALLVASCSFDARGPGEAASARAMAKCDGAAAIEFACHERRYGALVARRGPGPAIADLRRLRRRSGFLRAACHQLMHVIGRASGRRDGLRAFEDGDPACSSGYYHGVVEAVTGRLGGHEILREGPAVCAPYRTREPRSLPHYNCAHGMGHGFMGVYASDVFRSLAACATLPDRWEQEHCEGGVFMENLTAMDNPERPARHLRPREPLYPCTVVAARHKASCYVKQAAYPIFLTSGDFGAAFKLCATTRDTAFRPACFRGIGAAAVVRTNKYVADPRDARATIRALCRLGRSGAARRGCVVGAVTTVVKDAATRRTRLRALCAEFRRVRLRGACSRAAAEMLERFPAARPGAGHGPRSPAVPAEEEDASR